LDFTAVQGRKVRFSQSQSKHRLFVGNIPKAWEKEELEKVLGEQGPGIQSVELLKVLSLEENPVLSNVPTLIFTFYPDYPDLDEISSKFEYFVLKITQKNLLTRMVFF